MRITTILNFRRELKYTLDKPLHCSDSDMSEIKDAYLEAHLYGYALLFQTSAFIYFLKYQWALTEKSVTYRTLKIN